MNVRRMRSLIYTTVFLVSLLIPGTLWARPQTAGIGIILGQPTGLSLKFWLDKTSAIDVAAAWSFLPSGALYAHADYLYHFYNLFPIKEGALPLYVGVGGSVTIMANPTIGIRIPVGIDYLFHNLPLDAFLEVGLGVSVFPATQVLGTGGIGIRYNF
ncbi:MAG TPA: hypothetical protein VMW73_11880 [Spirochaetia bacterium]|nr:hypothetical protein [Spirochaetia bacterium]